jgi:hypothetical protein
MAMSCDVSRPAGSSLGDGEEQRDGLESPRYSNGVKGLPESEAAELLVEYGAMVTSPLGTHSKEKELEKGMKL